MVAAGAGAAGAAVAGAGLAGAGVAAGADPGPHAAAAVAAALSANSRKNSRFVTRSLRGTAISALPRRERDDMVGPMDGQTPGFTVAIHGLTHPHSEMYLETLEALDEVVGIVLVDEDEAARRTTQTRKLRGSYGELEAALDQLEVTHVLVALPND